MAMSNKPFRTRSSELKAQWHVMDAEDKTLGRLSSAIARILQGKHKPIYVRHLNTGDFVIVVNAEKIRVTGNKLQQKVYYRHSGYHGGLKEQTLSELLEKSPTRVIKYAVRGMLPKSALGRRMLSRLKLYSGGAHPHEAQVEEGGKARHQKTESKSPERPDPKTKPSKTSGRTKQKDMRSKDDGQSEEA